MASVPVALLLALVQVSMARLPVVPAAGMPTRVPVLVGVLVLTALSPVRVPGVAVVRLLVPVSAVPVPKLRVMLLLGTDGRRGGG
ncbi:MAG: hypothetical protein IRZ07_17470 [Microbispora sp.]|nr:hypothetical protein [Microbispora sp.]